MPFLLFIFYILIEIALFIWIGGKIGVGWTLLWVLAGFIIGALMLRKGGSESRKWLQAAADGRPQEHPDKQVYWYIGGLLVMLPGFFTDFLGFMLVFPPTQAFVKWIFSLFIPETVQTGFTFVSNYATNRRGPTSANDDVIEGEVVEVPDPKLSDEPPKA